MIAVLASFGAVMLAAFVAVCFRHSLRLWWSQQRHCLQIGGHENDGADSGRVLDSPSPSSSPSSSQSSSDESSGRLFDAYVAYAAADGPLVNQILSGSNCHQFRLCLHHRDLPLSSSNSAEAIMKVAEASRSVLLVLTPQFLAAEWTRPDFRAGLMAALATGGSRKTVIVVLVGGGGQLRSMDLEPSLRMLLHSSQIVMWNEPGWQQQLEHAVFYAGGGGSTNASIHQLHARQLMPTEAVVGSGGYYYGAAVISPSPTLAPPPLPPTLHHYYDGGGGDHFYHHQHHQSIYSEVPEKLSSHQQLNISHI
jgi:TIR domain